MITIGIGDEMWKNVLQNKGRIEIVPDVGRMHIYYYGEQKSPAASRPEKWNLIKHEVHALSTIA